MPFFGIPLLHIVLLLSIDDPGKFSHACIIICGIVGCKPAELSQDKSMWHKMKKGAYFATEVITINGTD